MAKKKKPARNAAKVKAFEDIAAAAKADRLPKTAPKKVPTFDVDGKALLSAIESSGYGLLSHYDVTFDGKQYQINFEMTGQLDDLPASLQERASAFDQPTGETVTDFVLAHGLAAESIRGRDMLVSEGADAKKMAWLTQIAVNLGRIIERIEMRQFEPMISAATRQKAGAKRGAAKTNSKKVVETKTKRELYQLLVEGEMHRRRTTYARACTLVAVAQDVTPKTVRNNTTDPTIKPA